MALVSIFVGSTLAGCSRTRVKPVHLEIIRSGEELDFTADELFGGISCSIYDWARAEHGAPDVLRLLWRAHCPDRIDCARTVRYGDPRLQTELEPAPLGPSEPGECYLCSVRSDRGRGTVRFALEADGTITDCPHGE